MHTNQPGNSVCVGKDTSKQNIENMKANIKTKQQQLSNTVSCSLPVGYYIGSGKAF